MPIQMALTTNLVKIESAKQLDKQFPPINITVITEPIQNQRNYQSELEQKFSICIQTRQDDLMVGPTEVDIDWLNGQ
jgi:hypothetical protein